ncbi:14211_t:CDS:2, partial [Racocetra persica]
WTSEFSKVLSENTEDFLLENDFALSMAQLEFNRPNYQSEAEIYRLIKKFQDEQKNFGETRPIPVLTYFANVIKKNDIKYMREFARQADVFFKDYLISLAHGIKNNSAESDGSLVLKKLYDIDNKQLEKAYNIWIREGEAIQILEGVSLRTLNSDFLSSVLSQIMSNSKRQLVVLSVIGLESSGKSTLLNYLFQCGFSTSAGRCIKGAYMSYRHTLYKEKELDVLIIDSEGMGSTAAKYISRRTDFD